MALKGSQGCRRGAKETTGSLLLGGGRSQGAGERLQGSARVGRGVSLAVLLRTWCAVFVLVSQRVGREKGFLLLLLKASFLKHPVWLPRYLL